MRRALLALAATLGLWTGIGMAGPAETAEAITTYTLDNGLKVVLAPDTRVPKVVMNVRYSVGSMNEPAGRSGFAHLFEHLMFSGTAAWPNIFEAQSAVGNTINAWTMEDGTVYYVEGIAANLPQILSIEADRMANLGDNVDQRELDLQRAVVKNEMRQNVLDQAGGSGWAAFWSGLFPKSHPYSRTVIGSIADLDSATLDDVRGFFNAYYAPNNAALVLSGDFAVEDAKALIQQTFGLVPRGADVTRPVVADAAPTRIRLDLEDRMPSAMVLTGYTGPTIASPDNGSLAIAAELLGNGEIGALRNRLVNDKGIATSAAAAWSPGLLGGRFTVEAVAADGVGIETLEAELKAAIHDFVAQPIQADDLERTKRSLLLSARLGNEALRDRVKTLGLQVDMFGRVTHRLGDDPGIANATPASVEAAMRRVIAPDAESVLVLRPGARGGYPAVLTDSSGTPESFAPMQRAVVDIPKLAAREATAAKLPAMKTATLSNGIRVVHYTLPSAPLAYIAASARGGWSNMPEGKEGLLDFASKVAARGAGDRPYDAFLKAAKDIGAAIDTRAESQATFMTLSVPVEALDSGVAMLADTVQRPRFDQRDWDIARGETLDWLARREADLAGVASRAAEAVLFAAPKGKTQPDWSIAAVRSFARDETEAVFRKAFKPAATTFYSVGPLPVDAVAASLERSFGGWKGDGEFYVADAPPPASFPTGRTVLVVPEPGASQTALWVARPAPGVEEPMRHETVAVAGLLGGSFTSRLNSVIREQKGYSYGVGIHLFERMRTGSALVVQTTVQRDKTGPALQEVFNGFAGLATVPVTEDEVNRTITSYRQALAGEAETAGGLMRDLLSAVGVGSTLETTHASREARTLLELQAVAGQAYALSGLDPSLIVVAGDPEIVLPQLREIGLTDVRVVARETGANPAAPESERSGISAETPAAPNGNTIGLGADQVPATTQPIHACPDGKGEPPACVDAAN